MPRRGLQDGREIVETSSKQMKQNIYIYNILYIYIYIAILGCLGAFQICMEPETDMFLLGETNIYQEVAGFRFQS